MGVEKIKEANGIKEQILRCMVAFQVYHALKIGNRRRIDLDFEEEDYTVSIDMMWSLVNHFTSEPFNLVT